MWLGATYLLKRRSSSWTLFSSPPTARVPRTPLAEPQHIICKEPGPSSSCSGDPDLPCSHSVKRLLLFPEDYTDRQSDFLYTFGDTLNIRGQYARMKNVDLSCSQASQSMKRRHSRSHLHISMFTERTEHRFPLSNIHCRTCGRCLHLKSCSHCRNVSEDWTATNIIPINDPCHNLETSCAIESFMEIVLAKAWKLFLLSNHLCT